MAATERKSKKPPTFHYLPKSRAKQLKKSWVDVHKTRSKWKAQKRREGLENQMNITPDQGISDHAQDNTSTDPELNLSPDCPDKPALVSTPSHDKQPLHELRRISYVPKSLTQKIELPRTKKTPAHTHSSHDRRTAGRETGQPNMKLRMNVLLQKIKRDLAQ